MKLSLIGAGNLGRQLYREFLVAPEVEILQWMDRKSNLPQTDEGVTLVNQIGALEEVDCYVLAVADDAIEEISAQLPLSALVVHTAGGRPLTRIKKQERKGVFYPIQSFSSSRRIDFSKISIGIESSSPDALTFLKKLANQIKANPLVLDSKKRLALHLAAVFANNFTNHLLVQAEQICAHYDLSFDLLKPLLKETIDKLEVLSPQQAQTGPALRNDSKTLAAHRELLTDPELITIYDLLTKSIQKNTEK